MNLDVALAIVGAPDNPIPYAEALGVIGAHLGSKIEPPDGAVALSVDLDGRKLLDGAMSVWGSLRVYSVLHEIRANHYRPVGFTWLTGPPPADLPLLVFTVHVLTGVTVRELLTELAKGEGLPAAVTVLAAQARAKGRDAIREAHPDVEVITPRTPTGQTLAERANGTGPVS